MNIRYIALGIALAASSTAALAESATDSSGTKPRNDPDRVVCRTENEIGSLVHKRKTCLTIAQWRELSSETGNNMEKREALGAKPGGG